MKLKNKKEDFLVRLLGALGLSLLGNTLAVKGINRAGEGVIVKRQGLGILRTGYGDKKV